MVKNENLKKGLDPPEPPHSEGGGTLYIIKYEQRASLRSPEERGMVTRSHSGQVGGVSFCSKFAFCQLGENSNSQRLSLHSKLGRLFKAIRLATCLQKQANNQGIWRICRLPSPRDDFYYDPTYLFLIKHKSR